jgi:hypothetical protein
VRSAFDECGWTGIDPTNDFVMYAAGRGDETGTNIVKSTDRGNSFFGSGNFAGPAAWNSPFVIAPSSTNILYFGSAYLYRSTNAGGSWALTNSGVSLDGNPALSMAISSTNPDTVVVGMAPYVARSHVFLTTNAGGSWVNVTGTLPDRYPMDLAINPKNTKTVYATFGGFGTGHVFKSTDLGGSWSDISGSLPDAPTPAVLVDPIDTSVIFVGNDIGVYISTNSGASWSGYSEGLPEAVICADLSMNLSAHKLRIATHGNGVYERNVLIGASPLDFDYKAFGLLAPTNGSQVLLGSTVSPLKSSFRNNGALAQSDPFDVKLRILKGATELYTSTQTIAGLALAEIRQVTFAGSFTPPDTGIYTIEAISLAADQDPSNDTLKGTLHVIIPPSITTLSVTKSACTYTAIVGGTAGPLGDDVQKNVGLPFAFVFNGVAYDSVQISTNGWVEFGTGTPGSLYGLSTSGQIGPIGANENGRMGTTQHPTKVLGLWWDDMSTDPPGSSVTYTTQGLTPTRTFVVQWKDIRAYYDAGSTTTLLNFQLRLHEGTNIAEYDYGSITAGTFGGSDIGAMVGTKDEYGGDYHYFDFATMKTGLASEVTTNLSPLTNWPGPDSCYQIQSPSNALTVSYAAGWNMVSVPFVQSSYAVRTLFPTALNGRAFDYTGGSYQIRDSLIPGRGYWAKLPSSELHLFTGESYSSDTLTLQKGWNMIGSLDHDAAAPSGGIIMTAMFGYSGSYSISTVVKPGKAYWIKTSAAGDIAFGPAATPQAATPNVASQQSASSDYSSYTRLTMTDALGRSQQLYIADDPEHKIPAGFFEMPPAAPDGPDMRFASQNIVETVGDTRPHEFPIKVSGIEYPLTLSWHIASASASASLLIGKSARPMAGEGSVALGAGDGPISVGYSGGAPLPSEFTLAQNFPNPFNPKTRIEFTLPAGAKVAVRVYNILGEEVATLVDQTLDAGYQSVDWDAANMPSGIYIYHITAGTFSASRKMLLLK